MVYKHLLSCVHIHILWQKFLIIPISYFSLQTNKTLNCNIRIIITSVYDRQYLEKDQSTPFNCNIITGYKQWFMLNASYDYIDEEKGIYLSTVSLILCVCCFGYHMWLQFKNTELRMKLSIFCNILIEYVKTVRLCIQQENIILYFRYINNPDEI